MNTVLIVITVVAIIVGLAGCVVPVIPGIPLAFAAIFLYSWYDGFANISVSNLIVLAVITLLSVISDFIIIALSGKLAGSSKHSAIAAAIGAVIGLFVLPPLGIIIFCFLGAYVTELYIIKDSKKAIRAALGSLAGLFSGMVFKLAIGVGMLVFFFMKVI